jgi:hypothetical protein
MKMVVSNKGKKVATVVVKATTKATKSNTLKVLVKKTKEELEFEDQEKFLFECFDIEPTEVFTKIFSDKSLFHKMFHLYLDKKKKRI